VNSLTEENYLKALWTLSGFQEEVTTNDLSRHLGIKMPTVTSMMKRLAGKRLVIYESYKPIRLSEKGKREAAAIVRKHRLTEMFLVQKMGFGWEQVHVVAEQIEHIQSAFFFDKMDELLGSPKFDPHGSPIPDKHGKTEENTFQKLSDCVSGDHVVICGVLNSSEEFLKFLNVRKLGLGVKIRVKSKEAFDGSLQISYAQRIEILSGMVCEKLLVEKI
jgi:DtxR family Mn-dependent transcriptional regulator